MDNLSIRTNAYKPTFGTAHLPKNFERMLPSRQKLAQHIYDTYKNVIYAGDELGRTFEKFLDDAGYDIIIRDNNRHQGIRVDILKKRLAEDYLTKGWDMFDSNSFVKIYKSKEKFNPEYIINTALKRNLENDKDKKASLNALLGVATAFGIVIAACLGVKCSKDKQFTQSVKQNATEMVEVARDTVSTLPDSTFKNAQKAVKSVK